MTVQLAKQDARKIIAATFPDYKGRKIRLSPMSEVPVHDLNWSGGTRSRYRACTIEGSALGSLDRYNAMAPWANPAEGTRIPIVPGAVVVRHSIFCGKDTGLTIYAHPDDMPRWIGRAGGGA